MAELWLFCKVCVDYNAKLTAPPEFFDNFFTQARVEGVEEIVLFPVQSKRDVIDAL